MHNGHSYNVVSLGNGVHFDNAALGNHGRGILGRGGCITAARLAQLNREGGERAEIRAFVDSSACGEAVPSALAQLGIRCTDLVSLPAPAHNAAAWASQPADALLVNSDAKPALVRAAVDAAQAHGCPLYAVLNPALPVAQQVVLLKDAHVSVSNLTAFTQLARAMGVACPSDVRFACPAEVADAMVGVAHTQPTGDVVVTLGDCGCLVGSRGLHQVAQVRLAGYHWDEVQEAVASQPGITDGAGDRFFAVLVAAHLSRHGAPDAVLRAAHTASLDVVRSLVGGRVPDNSWFVTRILRCDF